MILEGAVLEELEAADGFFENAGIDLEWPLEVEVRATGVIFEGPLAPGVIEGRLTANIVVEVGNTFGE